MTDPILVYSSAEENERFLGLICNNTADKTDSLFTTYNEKTLHNTLKSFFVYDQSMHEVKLEFGPVADAIDSNGTIYEIQSRNLYKLKGKLAKYNENNANAVVVLPIVRKKRLAWIDNSADLNSVKSRLSPKKLNVFDYFREFYSIKEYISSGIKLMLFFIDVTEYRLLNGWGNGGKRGSTRYDLIPENYVGHTLIDSKEFFRLIMPQGLNEEFTAKELSELIKTTPRKTWYVLAVLEYFGYIENTDKKQGKAFVYKKKF